MDNDSSAGRLRSFVERIEHLNSDREAISDDTKLVFQEAAGCGFDAKALREVIRLRKMETEKRQELEGLVETYRRALGMAV